MRQRSYFKGWYYKVQTQANTLALIPAIHTQENGDCTASLQIITQDEAFFVSDFHRFAADRNCARIRLDSCKFTPYGIQLHLDTPDCQLFGRLQFGPLTPLPYPAMGPLSVVPFLECYHHVASLVHSVNGTLTLNGKTLCFDGSTGYIEGDSGTSFPQQYVWTQCSFVGGALMLCAAKIPILNTSFVGCLATVLWQGKSYRFATYLGGSVTCLDSGTVHIQQGSSCLQVQRIDEKAHSLQAPAQGAMTRSIRESPVCTVQYRLVWKGQVLFSFTSACAALEWEW